MNDSDDIPCLNFRKPQHDVPCDQDYGHASKCNSYERADYYSASIRRNP
ncbi:hypothetical protein LHJ74_30895 [Streptomyces sp. N2-109]|uniref:Uncharacterized protein n=1 Tax=Streptomyces gossypii TaxID=2883101 RepID=A0ABT2K421_9ACTN|nr:hypothetical protein [Streptomyces gossypii]MCT2594265.1 hypothetical protein [Streptomyces gossypii]